MGEIPLSVRGLSVNAGVIEDFFNQVKPQREPGVLSATKIELDGNQYTLRFSSYQDHGPRMTQEKPVLKARLSLLDPDHKSNLGKIPGSPISRLNLNRGEVAACELTFSDVVANNLIEVTSGRATREEYRRNGYDLLIGSLRDQATEAIMRTNPEFFDGKRVHSLIIDTDKKEMSGNGARGISFTSELAEVLGYERVDNRGKFPCYRKVIV